MTFGDAMISLEPDLFRLIIALFIILILGCLITQLTRVPPPRQRPQRRPVARRDPVTRPLDLGGLVIEDPEAEQCAWRADRLRETRDDLTGAIDQESKGGEGRWRSPG